MPAVRQRPAKKKRRSPTGASKKKTPANKRTTSKRHRGQGYLGKSPLCMFLYGPPGVGKSSLASYFPNAGFIHDPQEDGIITLSEYGQCKPPVMREEADSWQSLMNLLARVAGGEFDIDSLIVESMTGIEYLCFQYHCQEHFDGDWSSKGFYSYMQGPVNASKTDWPDFINALEAVRLQGINVILTAHSIVKPYKNPEGADYEQYMPFMDKNTWQMIKRWVKCILFYNYHVEINEKGIRAKAELETEERFLYTQWSAAYEAKNQYGLPPLIAAGTDGEEAYNAIEKAFKKLSK